MSDDLQALVDRLPSLGDAVLVTLEMTLGGAILAMVVALVLGGFGARTRTLWVRGPSRVVIEFFRGTSLVVQIFWIFYVLPTFGFKMEALAVAIVALGLNYGAYAAEVVRGSIESVPTGQWEAATALNLPKGRTWFAIILPQAIRKTLPGLGNYAVSMFKETPFLFAITVVEMYQAAQNYGANTFSYIEPLTIVGLLFLLVSYPTSLLVRRMEIRLA